MYGEEEALARVTAKRSRNYLSRSWWVVSVLLVWFITRLFAFIALTSSGGSILVDVQMYEGWSRIIAAGSAPSGDPTWQYPPFLMLPIWVTQLAPASYQTSFIWLTLVADLLLLLILMKTQRRTDGSTVGVWIWATAGLWIGPILLARLDVFTALPAVMALALLARPKLAGAFAALGAMMKIWPGLLLIAFPRKEFARGVLGFLIAAVALGLVSFLLIEDPWAFLGNQQARGLNGESLAALPYILANFVGAEIPFEYRFGSNEVAHESAEVVAPLIGLLGFLIIGLLLIVRLLGGLDRALAGDVALVVVLASILISRVFSPQYFIWLGALAAFALLNTNTRMRIPGVFIITAAVLTQPLYPWFPGAMYTGEPWAVALHTARLCLLSMALVYGLIVTIDGKRLLTNLRKPLALREENRHPR